MAKLFRPMRAASIPLEDYDNVVPENYIVMDKIDGIRALVVDGTVKSRKLLPIPNPLIRGAFEANYEILKGFDGELVCGNFDDTQSFIMSEKLDEGTAYPRVYFHVFDYVIAHDRPYTERYVEAVSRVRAVRMPLSYKGLYIYVVAVPAHKNFMRKTVSELLKDSIDRRAEGVIIRHPDRPYKFGDSTYAEAGLLKVKTCFDTEARVTGYRAQREVAASAHREINELGLMKRPTKKDDFVVKEALGSLEGVLESGAVVKVGSGLSAQQRIDLWEKRDELIGRVFTLSYFELTKKGIPRFPVFKGFRND